MKTIHKPTASRRGFWLHFGHIVPFSGAIVMDEEVEFKIPIGMIVIAVFMILGYGLFMAGPEGAAALMIAVLVYTGISLVGGVIAFMIIGALFSMNFGVIHRALLKLTAIILLTVGLSLFFMHFVGCFGLIVTFGLYWIFINWLFEFDGKEGMLPAFGLIVAQILASFVFSAMLRG